MDRLCRAALAVALCLPGAARAAALTLDDALERARRDAPALLAARLRPDEARGRLAGASALLHDNPVVEGAAGRRSSDRATSTDVDTALSQTFELGGRRGARIAGARAEVDRETASAEDATRLLLRDVAQAFLRALAGEERLRVLRANADVADELARIADRRHAAGDIADLERNVARIAASRARAEVGATEAACDRSSSELAVLLGMGSDEPLALRGDLRARDARPLDELLRAATDRPDLRALAGDVAAAEAEVRLGEGQRWPDLGVRVGYKREEGADIPQGGLSVSVPIFATGQEQRVGGAARARRLRIELAARRRAVEVEVRAAFAAHRHLATAADDLARGALPLLDDDDALARRSYEAGELRLPEYLLVQRETLAARIDWIERSLDAALAGVELDAQAGVLR